MLYYYKYTINLEPTSLCSCTVNKTPFTTSYFYYIIVINNLIPTKGEQMLEKVKQGVINILGDDNSGHGMEHINRVLTLSFRFADTENANTELVELIALLHDVDDRKLFKNHSPKSFPHARKIMNDANVNKVLQEHVLEELNRIGYHKRLDGIIPNTIEGKIVSDADMCDALGVSGIIRTYAYDTSHNLPFFDRTTFPRSHLTSDSYINDSESSGINHLIEKCLGLNRLILTKSGQELANKRRQVIIDFLYNFFEEENEPEWTEYLDNFLATEK